MSKVLCAALMLGCLLAAAPVQAQGTTSSTSSNSDSWTDVGGMTMKGRLGLLKMDVDSVLVSEIRFSYADTSSYRIGSVTVYHGPDRLPYPPDFVTMEAGRKSPRTIRLKKAVLAGEIQFLYSNLFKVDGEDVRILVR